MKKNQTTPKIVDGMFTVLIPLIVLMLSIRLLITPLFAQYEYRLPGFPEDPYGFTMEERLRCADPSITYLVNSEDIQYLETLTFENGEQQQYQQQIIYDSQGNIISQEGNFPGTEQPWYTPAFYNNNNNNNDN